MQLGIAGLNRNVLSIRMRWIRSHGCQFVLRCLFSSVIFLFTVNCGNESTWRPTPGLSGCAKLEGQSDHSGVLLTIADLDSTAATDSAGFFSFAEIPDGHWHIQAQYPYFESRTEEIELADGMQQSPMNFTLRQLLQFWIEPAETTVSMSESDDEYHFEVEVRGYLTNISRRSVSVKAIVNPWRIVAIRPKDGLMTGRCDTLYGYLSSSTLFENYTATFGPGDILGVPIRRTYQSRCFEPGDYEMSWVITDQFHHPEHFWPYSELSRTIAKKKELLRPSTITLME